MVKVGPVDARVWWCIGLCDAAVLPALSGWLVGDGRRLVPT